MLVVGSGGGGRPGPPTLPFAGSGPMHGIPVAARGAIGAHIKAALVTLAGGFHPLSVRQAGAPGPLRVYFREVVQRLQGSKAGAWMAP